MAVLTVPSVYAQEQSHQNKHNDYYKHNPKHCQTKCNLIIICM